MKELFKKNLRVSIAIHLGLLMLLIGVSWLGKRFSRRTIPETITVEIMSASPPPARSSAPPVARQSSYRPVPAARIRKSRRRVRRQRPVLRTPSSEELKKMLSANFPDLPEPRRQTAFSRSLPDWYYALVRQRLYEAWVEPPASEVPPGTTVRAVLIIRRDGTVTSSRIEQASGITLMDESVQQALMRIRHLEPLPPAYAGKDATISVDFVLSANDSL